MMVTTLRRMLEQFAGLLVTAGVSAGQSTLYALIFIYLLVTAVIAVPIIIFLVRRRQHEEKKRYFFF